ncbi:MAG: ADP-ribosylglycohydrolase family protein [Myxococcota bacterium]
MDDLAVTARQAQLTAEPTHAHPEGQAGAIAVALAAALAARVTHMQEPSDPSHLFAQLLEYTPESEVKHRLEQALHMEGVSPSEVGQQLGTGIQILAEDTVPMAIWCALHHLDDVPKALWATFDALPSPECDCDTIGAIVGGIVALTAHPSIPESWLSQLESLEPQEQPID